MTRTSPGIPRSASRPRWGDDGAVLVEAVMVLPILLALIFGLVDFGVGLRDRQVLQSATRNAARAAAAASTYSSGRDADRSALTTMWASLQNSRNLTVNKVVVFKANPTPWPDASSVPLTTVPAFCKNTTAVDTGAGYNQNSVFCNVYSAKQVSEAATVWSNADSAGVCSTTSGFDRWWCPTTRATALTSNGFLGPDYLGVYVQVTYKTLTKFFARTITMEDTTIVRLEPK
jgi:Flp pilus assembly protein TadG